MRYLHQDLFNDLQEYLGLTEEQLRTKLSDSHQAVVDHWESKAPTSEQDRVQFYKETDTYLTELAAWILDFPTRTTWNQQVSTFAERLHLKTALDFGCGIANEGLQLALQGLTVHLCEVNRHSLDFALWRAKKHDLEMSFVTPGELGDYDLINLLDVIGHVEDPENLIIQLARHGQYLFYTEDFQIPGGTWPMHSEKPVGFDRLFKGLWRHLSGGFYESLVYRPEVSIVPTLKDFSNGEGGVKRQVEALVRELPKMGLAINPEPRGQFGHIHATAYHPKPLVFTSHGFYPWDTKFSGEMQVNSLLKRNIAAAQVVISVSDEAKEIIEGKLKTPVHLIRNGVFLEDLDGVAPGNSFSRFPIKGPYFLWSKNNTNGVCDPTPSLELARLLPQYQFVFTQVNTPIVPPNVLVVGTLPHHIMLGLIKDCSVYLGTTKEQFSVQTLEAMGMGKPVLCFPEGGNGKVVEHKRTGFIAQDLQSLVQGAEYCMQNRVELGINARRVIEAQYTWNSIMPQIREVYAEAIDKYILNLRRPLVSIIIPHYNLFEYVTEAIDSALSQTVEDIEVLIVDDGSKDVEQWEALKERYQFSNKITFIRQENAGVAAARNLGIRLSHGRYISCLDADDIIKPNFLELLVPVLEEDWNVGIAYTNFELFGEAQGVVKTAQYDFSLLVKGNFIPCCNVFRREAWERAGGYKDINPSWEDYELWLNMGKLGFSGKKVEAAPFLYRKKGAVGRDWESQAFVDRLRGIVNSFHPDLYPPTVSVIIPSYKQTHFLLDTLKSLEQQTFRDFDVIVVDDGNRDSKEVEKVVESFQNRLAVRLVRHSKNLGLAQARNTGVRESKGKYVLTLDSDDMIKPTFLQQTIGVLEDRPDLSIVYTDIELFGAVERVMEMPEYDYSELLRKNLMACASPYRREVFDAVGGYPTNMQWGWEDYSFWIQAGRLGYCAARWPEALFMYRRYSGSMIMEAQSHVSEMRKQLKDNSPDVFRGERPMACCGKTRVLSKPGASKQAFIASSPQGGEYPLVELVYIGKKPLTVRGQVSGTIYQMDGSRQTQFVDPRDATQLLSRGDFVRETEEVPV